MIDNARRVGAVSVLALGLVGFASAQSETLATMKFKAPNFRSASQSQRQTWNTVLLISAGVAILGALNDDSTLTLLGVAGVVLSLVEQQQHGYFRLKAGGLEFANSGPLSFGFNPFGRKAMDHGVTGIRPGPYLRYSVRF